MKISAKIFPWDNPIIYDSGNWSLQVGENVIVNIDSGIESAVVEKVNVENEEMNVSKIVRKATSIDLETIERNNQRSKEVVKFCRELVKERGLPMKIVDAHYGFDGGRITFAFTAEKRIDFRDLVKILSKKFQRSIRLQQTGSRDEARKKGGFGACGRELCCIKFSGILKSVTTDDARVQQMGQRGSERLSGLCGRLKCCLGFEAEQYRKMLENFPEAGVVVSVEGKSGIIIDRNIMSGEVTVELEDKSRRRVSIKKLK